jgi:secreted trypsin-like serine protease
MPFDLPMALVVLSRVAARPRSALWGIASMRRLIAFLILAAMPSFAAPAHAVMRGEVARDPSGVRQSVVRIESSLGELCSGAVIGPDLVLTAAHCLMEPATYRVVVVDRGFRQRSMRAVAAVIHPAFVPGTTPRTQPGVDLAILKLERPLGPEFLPLDPRRTGQVGTGSSVMLAGFGVVAEGQKRSARTLRQTNLVSLGPLQVMNRVLVVADSERLAASTGAGACRGDSGGPILAPAGGGGYQLLGIVSWSSGALGSSDITACGGLTAVTPISEHVRWITEGATALGGFSGAAAVRGRQSAPEGEWMRKR